MILLTAILFYLVTLIAIIYYLPNGLKDKLNLMIALIGLCLVMIVIADHIIGPITKEAVLIERQQIGSGRASYRVEDASGTMYWGFSGSYHELKHDIAEISYLPMTSMIVSIKQRNLLIYDGNSGISFVFIAILVSGCIVVTGARKRIYKTILKIANK